MITLTKTEDKLLRDIASEDTRCYKLYRPARSLVDHGLARWRGGTHDFGTLYPTPEGRAFLKAQP